jgi:WD40 repeat protein
MRTTLACPSAEALELFLSGQLSAAEAEPIVRHVGECPQCAAIHGTVQGAFHPQHDGKAPAGPPGLPLGFVFPSPPQSADELGRLGGYRVLKVLGSGGMGVVFHAEDPVLGRPVALKVMLPSAAAESDGRERFLREARAAAAVEDDHIVAILHVGEDGGMPFLVMPLLRGESLEDRILREKVLPITLLLHIGREVALGLAAAHACSLIHRDVKPANVWLEGETGRVKLLDFGLARFGGATGLTARGIVLGTPCYMAPEQARGAVLDARADLFSLGCVLYRAATGRLPFHGDDTLAILTALAVDAPPPPQTLNAEMPPELSDLIMRLLSKDPAGRPESAAAVCDALQSIKIAPAPVPAPPPPATPTRQGTRWRGVGMAVAVMLLGVLTAVVGRMTGAGRGEAPDPAHGDPPPATGQQARPPASQPADTPAKRRPASPLDLLEPPTGDGAHPGLEGVVAVLRGHDVQVGPVAFGPDGHTLASGGGESDQAVCLWDLDGPAPRRRWKSERLGGAVSGVAFSADGQTLAASLWDGTVRLWDLRSGAASAGKVLRQPQIRFTCVAFAGDGRALAAGTDRGTVWQWDLDQDPPAGNELQVEGLGIVGGVAFAPAGKTLAAAGGGVFVWDQGDPQQVQKVFSADGSTEARGLAFGAEGGLLAAAYEDGAIRLAHPAKGFSPGPLLRRHTGQVWSVAFSPDGRSLVSGGWDGRVVLWDVEAGTRRREWLLPGEHIGGVSFARDGWHIAFSAADSVSILRLAPPGKP